MPRAFLITRRRYDNGAENFEETMRDSSPERGVSVAEFGGGQPTSDGASECGSETSSECPEELYNLTKLAEVSLAAAAGTLIHPAGVGVGLNCLQGSGSPCRRREVDHLVDLETVRCDNRGSDGQALEERTRLFFERIEAERKIFDRRSPSVESRVVQRIVRNVTTTTTTSSSRKEQKSTPITTNRKTNHHHGNRKNSLTVLQNRVENSTKSDQENEDHECPDCGKRYSTSSNLARHRQTHRSLGDKKARRCPHCDKVYVSMPAFSMHVRTHNQGCKCHYCGKCFSRPWLLQGHIRTHTGEKPFKCTICNKAFADKSNLRAHIQTHSNTKPHVCGRCGKAFALKSYLYKHEESSCMRASQNREHRASSEKREPEPPRVSPLPRRISAPVTASPTSVIVPRLQNLGKIVPATGAVTADQQVAPVFSAIRHTKSSGAAFEDKEREGEIESTVFTVDEKSPERPVAVEISEKEIPGEIEKPERRLDAQMVIRTSVISPNPEHLGRLSAANANAAGNRKSNFEFNASRNSAFSRTGGMTLNLAIA